MEEMRSCIDDLLMLEGSRKVISFCFFECRCPHHLDRGHVGDTGADTALVVDALKVSLAVRRRGTLVACRAFFSV